MPLTYAPRPVEGLHLGRDFDADRLWNLTGALDDARIYGRGLSTAEIAALAAGGP